MVVAMFIFVNKILINVLLLLSIVHCSYLNCDYVITEVARRGICFLVRKPYFLPTEIN